MRKKAKQQHGRNENLMFFDPSGKASKQASKMMVMLLLLLLCEEIILYSQLLDNR
jgi:hypothetical protein